MQTFELIASLPRAERGLGAHRWGLTPTVPRVMATRLLDPTIALRVCRRGADAGAAQLVRLMVEHGGAVVPRQATLERDAERLEGWFPMVSADAGWFVPKDFAFAAVRYGERERFFAATLLGRLSHEDVTAVADELGIATAASWRARAGQVLSHIQTPSEGLDLKAAAEATAALQDVAVTRITAVTPVAESGGRLFDVTLQDGATHRVCPRELAEEAGAEFMSVSVAMRAVAARQRAMPAVRVPEFQEVGAIVRFSTSRALEEAMKLPAFRSSVARRVDERTVATRPSAPPAASADLLVDLGFHVDPETVQ